MTPHEAAHLSSIVHLADQLLRVYGEGKWTEEHEIVYKALLNTFSATVRIAKAQARLNGKMEDS